MTALPSLPDHLDFLPDVDPALMNRALGRAAASVARHPGAVLSSTGRYVAGLGRAALRTGGQFSGVGGAVDRPRDKRFEDPAWTHNPLFIGLREVYDETCVFARDLLAAAEVDDTTRRKAEFALEFLLDAAAPTNLLPLNPAALKHAFDTGGVSIVRGVGHFLDDLVNNGGVPRQVDDSGFEVGRNLATTPGKVVYRNDLMELIQYDAQTEEVHEVPLLASPPWINKYYVMDLAPGRSFLEWAVEHGHTVFAISYRQPDATMREITMEDYLLHGPLRALEVMEEITGCPQANIVGLCLGGALTGMLVAYLNTTQPERVRSVTLLNTMLDFSEPGVLGAFTDPDTVDRLEQKMSSRGYLEGKQMAGTFDALRSNDLIFNYVVNNWLLGKTPPAFDILAWNADSTRMPADMHTFYLRQCYIDNTFAHGDLELDGRRLSPKDINCDAFVVAAENDHIVPWKSSYKTTQLVSGAVEFVLSSAGHIAGIVNPPSPKARYWVGESLPADPERWRSKASEHAESWWLRWAAWAAERGGAMVPARTPGSATHPPLDDAPGTYVLDRS